MGLLQFIFTSAKQCGCQDKSRNNLKIIKMLIQPGCMKNTTQKLFSLVKLTTLQVKWK